MDEAQTQGTPEPSDPYVSIDDASTADLETFIKSQESEPAQPEEEISPEAPAETSEKSEPTQPSEPQTPPPASPAEDVVARMEKLSRQLEAKERFIQHQATELGEFRKRYKEESAAILEHARELAQEDPIQAFRLVNEVERSNADFETKERTLQTAQDAIRKQKIFFDYVKPDEVSMDDMVSCLSRDGIEPEFVDQFRQNPFAMTGPDTMIHLAKRAKAEKAAQTMAGYLTQLMNENKQLKAQLQNKPQDIVSKIAQAAKQPPSMTAASGASVRRAETPNEDPDSWSRDELEAFLGIRK